MGFPYDFESNFEAGLETEWTGTGADTESRLSVIHYTELARRVPKATPFRGAYCALIELSGSGTADAFLASGAIALGDTDISYFRFSVFFAENFVATVNNTFAILELQGLADDMTVSVGGRVVAATGEINLGVGAAATGAVPTAFTHGIRRGVWHQVHVAVTISTGAVGTAAITVTAEDEPFQGSTAASVTGKTNIAVTRAVLGMQDHLTTTTGIMLLDNFAMDSEPLPILERFPEHLELTKGSHVFVGGGAISGLTLLTGSAPDNVLRVYDTDRAVLDKKVAEIDSVAATETVESASKFSLARGCYVTLDGTEPRAMVHIDRSSCYSSAGIRRHGIVA